jgi:O-acetylhomoserine (thiol)-lyase
MTRDGWGFETLQIHAATEPDPTTGARAVPIYQTTSYAFRDTQHAADLFSLAEQGNIYTRIMNPTQHVFEQRVADLEGGVGGLAVASGQAAETVAILNLLPPDGGGHVVSSASLYGGTYNLFNYTLPRLGVDVDFVEDPGDLDEWGSKLRDDTIALYGETIGNPKGDVLDVEGISQLGRDNGIPLIVDNTLASPYLANPIQHGAAVVVHSATKFIGGHGTTIGGVIVDGGNFDFGEGERFPGFTTPDPSYNGMKYWEALGPGAFIAKARVQFLRDIGPAISPFNAFLLIQGLETLSLRMERHVSNAQRIAEWLEANDAVEWVRYPGLESSEYHDLGRRYLPRGAGAILSFGITGGVDAGRAFVDATELFSHLANVGDVRSLIIHPATTTHSQLSPEEQAEAGVHPELVRLSVGLETVDDLIADLEAGFRAAKGS